MYQAGQRLKLQTFKKQNRTIDLFIQIAMPTSVIRLFADPSQQFEPKELNGESGSNMQTNVTSQDWHNQQL